MNRDELTGRLMRLRGRVRQGWGALTGNRRIRAEGRRDRMVGHARQTYGKSRARIQRAFDSRTGRL